MASSALNIEKMLPYSMLFLPTPKAGLLEIPTAQRQEPMYQAETRHYLPDVPYVDLMVVWDGAEELRIEVNKAGYISKVGSIGAGSGIRRSKLVSVPLSNNSVSSVSLRSSSNNAQASAALKVYPLATRS